MSAAMRIRRFAAFCARGRVVHARGWALMLGLALSACATNGVAPAKVDSAALEHYRATGYPVQAGGEPETLQVNSWGTQMVAWSARLVRRANPSALPVLVYLPALGESDDAPNRWFGAWARAGYAVLVIQALDEDAHAWTSPEALSGDFARVARARFAPERMDDRLQRLALILTALQARSLRGDAALQGLDWTHVALAGADLGAYTVQEIAARSAAASAPAVLPLPIMAYLVISPYYQNPARKDAVSAAAAPTATPLLAISSDDDLDAYGLVTDSALRRQAYDRLAGPDSLFLDLGSATHRWLSGAAQAASSTEGNPAQRRAAPPEAPDRRRGRTGEPRAAPGNGRDGLAPLGDEEELTPDKAAKLLEVRRAGEQARAAQLTHAALRQVSFERVSLAFLDAAVRQNASARDWLAHGAGAWLQEGERLRLH